MFRNLRLSLDEGYVLWIVISMSVREGRLLRPMNQIRIRKTIALTLFFLLSSAVLLRNKLESHFILQMPVLATIKVSFDSDMIYLDAPGMAQLGMPTLPDSYVDAPSIRVESAGPYPGGTWSLAFLDCKQHVKASDWMNVYLNRPADVDLPEGRRVNGKMTAGKFAVVRSMDDVVDLGKYPPIFPLIEKSKTNASYKARFEGNYRRLSDFAPFLLVSESSARFLVNQCEGDEYPTRSFRGNIIVDGKGLEPWAEETWAKIEISSEKHDTLVLHTIKQCPRCTVPCRDQTTGKFLFQADPLKLWKVLKAIFPRKFHDPEWGSWAGVFMGVYMGHNFDNGKESKLMVGDIITPKEIVPWDAHLQRELTTKVIMVLAVILGIISAIVAYFIKR
jgi:hypothetical protein